MSKKSLLSERDKELREMAEQYEAARAENKSFYLDAEEWANLTGWYATRHQYARAFEVAEYGLEMHPDNTALLVELAHLSLNRGQEEKAEEVIGRIAEETSEVKVLKARLLLENGRTKEAEALIDSIEDKDELANIVDISYMYIDMGLPEKALVWLERGQELYADEELYTAVSGDCYYALEQFDKASSLYNKLIDNDPYSASFWFGMARCYFEQRILDKTIEACDFANVCDETFADAYLMKGNAFLLLGNEEEAMKNFRQAEKYNLISSGFLDALTGLSKVVKEEWEEGYEYLEKAIANKNYGEVDLPSLYVNAALCLHNMGKKRKAHQYCKKAYALAPEDADLYLIEGRIYMEEGDLEKCVKRWAKALEYAPYASTWYEIGLSSMETGLLNYAKLAFERVKEMEPDFEYINERLTSLYILLKDKENFMKYNRLCKHPFNLEELEKFRQTLQDENEEELAMAMRDIFNALQ